MKTTLIENKKKVKIPIYSGNMFIHLVENWKGLNKEFHFDPKLDNSMDGCVFTSSKKDGCTEFHIAFKGTPSNSLIAHESVHVVNSIFKHCLIDLDLDNDEPQAYLTEWVFEEVEQFFEELKLK